MEELLHCLIKSKSCRISFYLRYTCILCSSFSSGILGNRSENLTFICVENIRKLEMKLLPMGKVDDWIFQYVCIVNLATATKM